MKFKTPIPVLRGVHEIATQVLKLAGFSWELRRQGELKIGLWRKSWGKKQSGPFAKTPRRLVVVPGFGDTPLSWTTVLALLTPVLRKNFDELVLLDFPGYSGFLHHEKPFHSMDLMVAAVSDVLDSLQPDTILAHSLGGWLTQIYTIACGKGDRPVTKNTHAQYRGPRKVILTNPSGVITQMDDARAWQKAFQDMRVQGFDSLRPHLFASEPLWFSAIAGEFSNFLSKEEIRQFMESFNDEHLMTEHLHHIRCEMWLIWGENDTLVPVSLSRESFKAHSDKVGTILLKGAGHTPQLERPIATATLLGRIFNQKIKPQKLLAHTRWGWEIDASN